MDFLLTGNCSHIANAELIPVIGLTILSEGHEPSVICMPQEMLRE